MKRVAIFGNAGGGKSTLAVFHLRSRREVKQFLEAIKNEVGPLPSLAAQQVAQPDDAPRSSAG